MDNITAQAEQKPRKKKASIVKLAIFGFLLIVALVFCFTPMKFGLTTYTPFINSIKLGLDLKGGVYAVFEAVNTDTDNFESKLEGTRSSLEELLVGKGYSEATVIIENGQNIRVEVPDVDNASDVLRIIGEPAQISFVLDETGDVVITGDHVVNAEAGWTSQDGYIISLTLNSEGTTRFGTATSENIGKTMSIKVSIAGEETTISSPSINAAITNGRAIINGFSSQEDAQEIADQIMSGTFDVELKWRESSQIAATLGEDALFYGVIAGVVGFLLVIIYMCVFYRLLGVTATIALFAYIALYFFMLAVLPWVQLTLPGIAGVLLSIGMAVDANVIIYERIKDEYRNGKSIVASSYAGFKKATIAIVDSNVTTIIAAILLWILGTGAIRGFAMTLLVGIVLSLISALVFTRFIVRWFINISSNNAALYGLKRGVAFAQLEADMTDEEVQRRIDAEKEKHDEARRKKREKKSKGIEFSTETDSVIERAKADKENAKANHEEVEVNSDFETLGEIDKEKSETKIDDTDLSSLTSDEKTTGGTDDENN